MREIICCADNPPHLLSMLKFMGVKLDVLTDHEMYLFFEKSKRGGTTFMNEQYAIANNKYIPEPRP
jgi:hypothetical protein